MYLTARPSRPVTAVRVQILMTNSHRHHYIPQFYLKGFCNNDDLLAVYDKKRNVLKKGYYSRKSHFFEFNRNILKNIEGQETDFLENLYEQYDNQLSNLFEIFRENREDKDILNAQNIQNLKLFIAMMFWRIPATDHFVDSFFQGKKLKDIGFVIKSKLTNKSVQNDEIEKRLIKDRNYREACRFLILPLNTFQILLQESDLNNWNYYYSKTEAPHLCSDVPVLFKDTENFFNFQDDLILPLTSSKILIFSKKDKHKVLYPEFRFNVDVILFHQAHRYVCGPNRNYLKAVSEFYYRYENQVDERILKNEAFSF